MFRGGATCSALGPFKGPLGQIALQGPLTQRPLQGPFIVSRCTNNPYCSKRLFAVVVSFGDQPKRLIEISTKNGNNSGHARNGSILALSAMARRFLVFAYRGGFSR